MTTEGKGETVTVYKLGLDGQPTLHYSGRLVRRRADEIVLEAPFTFGRRELGYVVLENGDRFVEHFYTKRWYNIFVIYDGRSGALKGWYCNITRPAEIEAVAGDGWAVRAVDLALDYFVQPAGAEFVLDEDEFEALPLTTEEAEAARAGLAELQRLRTERSGPFAAT